MIGIALTILWFLLVLTFLVLIHELGHFLAAKLVKVDVLEFGVGYPPRAIKLFRRWGTDFSLNWLPLGGFVRLWGDDAEEELPAKESLETQGLSAKTMFVNQSAAARLFIIVAGVFINFAFGVLIFAGMYSYFGIPEQLDHVRVDEVLADSPAQEVGLQVGDQIYQVVTSSGDEIVVETAQQFSVLMAEQAGEQVTLLARRGEEEQAFSPTLRPKDRPADQAALGIIPVDREFAFYPWYEQPLRGAIVGLQDSFQMSKMILGALGDMLGKLFMRGQIPMEVSGPIGIVAQAYEMDILNQGWVGTLHYAALLSINLAVMNMLPLPPLDGGRGLFILLELIVGRAKRKIWEARVTQVGFPALLLLIVLISLKDVVKIVW